MDHTYPQTTFHTDIGTEAAVVGQSGEIPPVFSEPKVCGRGRVYCVICSNYEGKTLLDGTIIKMHRIPAAPDSTKKDNKSVLRRKQRKIWIQRIKSVRVDINITQSTRICSEHFPDGVYRGTTEEVPTRLHLDKPVEKTKPRPTHGRKTAQDDGNYNILSI